MTNEELAVNLVYAWMKYKPQREAEENAENTVKEANAELAALNLKRIALGLPYVSEPAPAFSGSVNHVYMPPGKTWRDELDAELLSIVKKFITETP
jgi:hypothetical protein